MRRPMKALILALTLLSLLTLVACTGSTIQGQARPTAWITPAGPANPLTGDSEASVSDPVAFTYNPADASLLKADSQGLSRWSAGSSWEQVNLPRGSSLSAVVVNPDQPARVYVSGLDLGVMRSDDGGSSWTEINAGLPSPDITALALHSFQRETLYAWVKDEGIYRTEDGGESWKRVPDQGPPDKNVHGLTHSTLPGSMNTGWLYAATPSGAYLSMDCF